MNSSQSGQLDDSVNPITPECEPAEEVFFSAQRSVKPHQFTAPKLTSAATATATADPRTPSSVWQKYRNRSIFFSAKVQSNNNDLSDASDMNTTPTANDYDDISNDLCAAMNHLTFTQKKRIENSLKEHSMITRSDPRKSFLELRSRSIAKKTLFDSTVVDSAEKTQRKFRATPHVTKTRKMLFAQSFSNNDLTSSVIMDQPDNSVLCELKIDIKTEPETIATVTESTESTESTENTASAMETAVPVVEETQPEQKDNGEKSKLVRFDDAYFDSEAKPERKTIGRKSVSRSLSTSILKDITSSHGIPNIALTKSLTKCKPFSFESRDKEYLKRKQDRIKLGEELKANPLAARTPAASLTSASTFHVKPISTSKLFNTAGSQQQPQQSRQQQQLKPLPPSLRTQPQLLNQLNSKRHFTFTKPATATSSTSTVNSTSTTTSSVYKGSVPKIPKSKLTIPIDFKFQSTLRAEQRAKNQQQQEQTNRLQPNSGVNKTVNEYSHSKQV